VSRSNPTVKERIAILETKIDNLIQHFTNHLGHHDKLARYLLAPILVGIIILILTSLL